MFNKRFNRNCNKQTKFSKGSNNMICDKTEPFIKLYKSFFNQKELNPTDMLLLSIVYDKEKLSVNHKDHYYDKKMNHFFIITSRDYLAQNMHVCKATITRVLHKLSKKGYLIVKHLFNGGYKIFAPKFKYDFKADYNNRIRSKQHKTVTNNPKISLQSVANTSMSMSNNASSEPMSLSTMASSASKSTSDYLNMSAINSRATQDVTNTLSALNSYEVSKHPISYNEIEKHINKETNKITNYYFGNYQMALINGLIAKIKANKSAYKVSPVQSVSNKAGQIAEKIVEKKVDDASNKIFNHWNNIYDQQVNKHKATHDNDVMSKNSKSVPAFEKDNLLLSKMTKSSPSQTDDSQAETNTTTIDTTHYIRNKVRKACPNRSSFSYSSYPSTHTNKSKSVLVKKNVLLPHLAKLYIKQGLQANKLGDNSKNKELARELMDNKLRMQSLVDNQINRISVPQNAIKSLVHFSGGCPTVFKGYVGAMYESKFLARKALKAQLKSKLHSKSKWQTFSKAFRFETNNYYRGAKHSLGRTLEDMLAYCDKAGIIGHWKKYYLSTMINYFLKAAKNYLENHGLKNLVGAMN